MLGLVFLKYVSDAFDTRRDELEATRLKESVRAAMRSKVRRILAQYGYPPDKEDRAVELLLDQAILFADAGA